MSTMSEAKDNTAVGDLDLAEGFTGCVASAVRQADRRIAAIIDERLREVGLRGTQLTLLGAVAALGKPSQRELAEATCTDQTTLSRNLERLLERGLIDCAECDQDRRMRRYALTPGGRRMLLDARPHWKAAQDDIARRLGSDQCAMLRRVAAALASP